MGTRFSAIAPAHKAFIEAQPIFFVGTATADSSINVSPKGMDYLRVLDSNRIVWLNLTGSSNESAAHVQISPRMTIMLCAFSGSPMIMRLFGTAKVIHHQDDEWQKLADLFPPSISSRQIFDMQVDTVQTSCGFGVPMMEYQGDRNELPAWVAKKSEEDIHNYWRAKNQTTLDGIETHIVSLNLAE